MKVGDKVTCRPDGKLRGCRIITIAKDRIRVEWYPGPQRKWMPKADIAVSVKWDKEMNV